MHLLLFLLLRERSLFCFLVAGLGRVCSFAAATAAAAFRLNTSDDWFVFS